MIDEDKGFVGHAMFEQRERIREYEQSKAEADQRRDDWQKRWVFSLSVGNGAAALAVSGSVLENGNRLIIGSAWCFFVGLICAGFLPFVLQKLNHALGDYWFAQSRRITGKRSLMNEAGISHTMDDWAKIKRLRHNRLSQVQDVLTFASAGFFMLGGFWGLLVLSN